MVHFFLSYSWKKQNFSIGIVPDIFQQKLSLLVIRPNEWSSIITLTRSQQESHSLDCVTKGEAWLDEFQQSETQKKSNCFGTLTPTFQCITIVRKRNMAYLKLDLKELKLYISRNLQYKDVNLIITEK